MRGNVSVEEIKLSEGEVELLKRLREVGGRGVDVQKLAETSGLSLSSVMSYIEALGQKGLIEILTVEEEYVELTDEGKRYAIEGLPERRLAKKVMEAGGQVPLKSLKTMVDMKDEEIRVALGWIRKKCLGDVIVIDNKKVVRVQRLSESDPIEEWLKRVLVNGRVNSKELSQEVLMELKMRKLITMTPRKRIIVSMTDRCLEVIENVLSFKIVGALTADLIKSGEWRHVCLKPYDVSAEPPVIYPARKHFYAEFLDKVKRILVGMGFVEAEGPYVEMEFWNFDVLFQAQDHPAREIHDCFILSEPLRGKLPERELVERVKRVHEEKWGYSWSEEQASRLILRSHTTAVSARYLAKRPKPPVKMFCVSKVFRPDVIDATHFIEFTQVDGIYGDKGVNLRILLGILQDLVKRLGFKEIKFRPSYFPFTEPSIEGAVHHPQLGWIECLGAGMFRPEVLRSLGVDYPVAAWGIGIDRLAMAMLEISDIRELCSRDLRFLRSKMVMW
ncbi:MAG: phenylalanine--tRNA ligase subunit alpha [Candidatus Nezhaarchaeota archaeon]|nr:phenylalanine--tRNA ligase subunit alpha [Candidatus Nezhaarchaeota archaeon]MCX8142049.1 phenylalanine--tRNA ligase subunit alpha [Candidatus Nezhaarchaeota archaeon]MDW8050170.1 phenylalanine--tRNA ligase subunit alpha [Nitrososphaerota archaeon]